MNELIQLTAAEAAQKVASGEVSAVELTQAHLDRIEATDGKALSDNRADGKSGLNAFLHINAEQALAEAAAVDADRSAAGWCADRRERPDRDQRTAHHRSIPYAGRLDEPLRRHRNPQGAPGAYANFG